MKNLILIFITLGFNASVYATDIIPGAKNTSVILIKGGTLHTVADGIKENTDLLIEDGKISQIGNNLALPKNATLIDATGKQVYPGLIGLVTNLGLVEIGAVRSTRDSAETGRATPEVKAHIAYNADSEIIPTIRSNGVTHVQITPDGRGLNGQSSLMQLDGWNWQDALVKAQTGMHLQWPNVGINKAFWERRSAEKQQEANDKARKALDKTFEKIIAYVNARKNTPSKTIDLKWEAMRPVLNGTQPLFIHANDYRQIEDAIQFAKIKKLDIILVSSGDLDKSLKLIKQNHIPVIYTASWGRPNRSDDGMDKAYSMPSLLANNNIEYSLAITGNWQVRNLAFAAGQSIAYGVPAAQALRTITLNPAKVLGVDDIMGSLTLGKQANIIISSGDLFDHLTHKIETMLIEGRMIDLDNRQKRLAKKYSAKPSLTK